MLMIRIFHLRQGFRNITNSCPFIFLSQTSELFKFIFAKAWKFFLFSIKVEAYNIALIAGGIEIRPDNR
jgi:hypothetical protein